MSKNDFFFLLILNVLKMYEITKKFPDGLMKFTGTPKGSKSLTAFIMKGYSGTPKESKMV